MPANCRCPSWTPRGIIAGVGGGIALLILILIVVMLQNKATPVAPTQPATTELAVVQTRQPPPDEPVTAVPIASMPAQVTPQPSGPKFDPNTGQPIAQSSGPKFDPNTGQPIPKFDPATGAQNW